MYNMSTDVVYEKKKAKQYAIISTVVYLPLTPVLFLWAAIMLSTGHDSIMEYIIRALRFSISITMPVCVCTMWSRYYIHEQYKKVPFFALFQLIPLGKKHAISSIMGWRGLLKITPCKFEIRSRKCKVFLCDL